MKAALAFFLASLLLFGCTQEYGGAAHPGQRQATGQEASPSVSYANLTYGNLAMENSVLAGIKNITRQGMRPLKKIPKRSATNVALKNNPTNLPLCASCALSEI